MNEHVLLGLATIIFLGIAAQWLAWRFKFPSILFLLFLGFIAGPITGFLNPDLLFGDLLMPLVSISVAIILFEGGLTLRLRELRDISQVLLLLVTVGVVVTMAVATLAAHYILEFHWNISLLLGAVVVVTGPTVIGPLLRHIRPIGKVGKLLKWEGIVIDPVGALLAILVFDAIRVGELQSAGFMVALGMLKTIVFGGMVGLVMARLLVIMFKHFWVPDFLQEAVTLMLVILAFVVSNLLQTESGLLAVTLMGLCLDNQKQVNVWHIVKFKENLRVLIISSLFIILSARLQLHDFIPFDFAYLAFLAILILVARPLAVFISSLGSTLSGKERLFLAWLAPRGIVAAAISSIFALRLKELNFPQAQYLVPVTFLVIIGTVAVYGLTARPLAARLQVRQSKPQGVMIVGAHSWARAMAKALMEKAFRVIMIDTNRNNVAQARLDGVTAYNRSILAENIVDEIDLDGIGRLMALTANDEANSLAALHFADVFERSELYQLVPQGRKKAARDNHSPKHLRGRFLFGEAVSYNDLSKRFNRGWIIKSTRLSKSFDYQAFCAHYRDEIIPLFLVNKNDELLVFTKTAPPDPKEGFTLIAMVKDDRQSRTP